MALPAYSSVPISDNGDPLVDVSGYGFVTDPQYFLQGLSEVGKMYLRKTVAEKLARIQKKIGFTFKIWDAYRPREVQKRLYDRYAAALRAEHPQWSAEDLESHATQYVNMGENLKLTPPHSTGGTVDLTLVNSNGVELNMGTGFDHFGIESSSLHFEEHGDNQEVRGNRRLLREVMQSEGFYVYPHEWWHFEYGTQAWALEYAKPSALFGETPSAAVFDKKF
jgi:D-alanyl-D-alanine dipeptidase